MAGTAITRYNDGFKIGSTSDATRPIATNDKIWIGDASETIDVDKMRVAIVSDIAKDLGLAPMDKLNLSGYAEYWDGIDYVDPDTLETGKRITNFSNGTVTDDATFSLSGYIDVTGSRFVRLYENSGVCFYLGDESKTFISGTTSGTPGTGTYTYAVPSTAVFCRANIYNERLTAGLGFVRKTSPTLITLPWLKSEPKEVASNPFLGKTVGIIGTSIEAQTNLSLAGQNYLNIVFTKLGATLSKVAAIPGQKLEAVGFSAGGANGCTAWTKKQNRDWDIANNTYVEPAVSKWATEEAVGCASYEGILTAYTGYDYIIMETPPNNHDDARTDIAAFRPLTMDYSSGAPETHISTYAGALIYLLLKILEANPTVKIIMIGWGSQDDGNPDASIVALSKEVAGMFNIRYVDLWERCGINYFNLDTYYDVAEDIIHPNWRGHQLMAEELLQLMLS